MKSFLRNCLPVILIAGLVAVMLLPACKKENTEIPCVITVKYQSDTNRVVPAADVVIGGQYEDIRIEGKTDDAGMFKAAFKLEAILKVDAVKDTNTGTGPIEDALTGQATVRLVPGETTYKTVFIN